MGSAEWSYSLIHSPVGEISLPPWSHRSPLCLLGKASDELKWSCLLKHWSPRSETLPKKHWRRRVSCACRTPEHRGEPWAVFVSLLPCSTTGPGTSDMSKDTQVAALTRSTKTTRHTENLHCSLVRKIKSSLSIKKIQQDWVPEQHHI